MTELQKKNILHFLEYCDIQIILDTGTYIETLPISTSHIYKNNATVTVKYHSALPYNSPTYNAILSYTLNGKFTILRTRHITGEGNYGGIFGLPSCQTDINPYSSRKWRLIQMWKKSSDSIYDIISNGKKTRIKITMGDNIYISETSIVMLYPDGRYSIRLMPIGIHNDKYFDITNFEIRNDGVHQRTWRIKNTPKRYSYEWFNTKLSNLLNISIYENIYKIYSDKDYTIDIYDLNPVDKIDAVIITIPKERGIDVDTESDWNRIEKELYMQCGWKR